MEILVIDGLSTDQTLAVIESHMADDPRIRVLSNHDRVVPTALNVGLAAARGTYLIRIDGHSVVTPDYVERIVGHLKSGDYAGVGGTKMAVGGSSVTSKVIASALSSRFGVGGSAYHYAQEPASVDHIPFGAYPVELLRDMGGWNETLVANEDFELDYRIRRSGGVLLLDPSMRIFWKSSQTLRDLSYQYQRYGRGKAAVARLHPQSLKLRHLFPVAVLVTLAGSGAAVVIARKRWPLVLDLPYLVFLLAAYLDGPLRKSSRRSPWLVPAVLCTMEMSWAWGFLRAFWQKRPGEANQDTYKQRDLSQDIAL
jgi:glycosyltransferase involved in cell wall biosynthesis